MHIDLHNIYTHIHAYMRVIFKCLMHIISKLTLILLTNYDKVRSPPTPPLNLK